MPQRQGDFAFRGGEVSGSPMDTFAGVRAGPEYGIYRTTRHFVAIRHGFWPIAAC